MTQHTLQETLCGAISSKKFIVFHYACSSLEHFPVDIGAIGCYDASNNLEQLFSRNRRSEQQAILEFLNYIREKTAKGYVLIGWNINKELFGLQPIIKKYELLTGKQYQLALEQISSIDLDEAIKNAHPEFKGGLHNLAIFNQLAMNQFVFGKDEITLLSTHQFQALDNSVMRKVHLIQLLAQREAEKKLVTQPNLTRQVYAKYFTYTRKARTFVRRYKIEIIIAVLTSLIAAILEYIIKWIVS